MNFDFTDEQKLLQAQARKALEATCPLSETRRVLESDQPYSQAAWKALCDLGVTRAPIPEAHGGLGLRYYELCLAALEIGRALAPVPMTGSNYLAAEALMLGGSEAQKSAWLPGLASGEAIVAYSDAETQETPVLANGRLDGLSSPVWDASLAVAAVVRAKANDRPTLVVVPLDQPSVKRRTLQSIDPTRDVSEITFRGASAEPLPGRADDHLIDRVSQRAAVLLAFEQLGGAERALAMARDYALQRRAFGRQIGSYQAIKHKLANIYTKVELARAHALYAAWTLSTDAPDLALAAASARVTASEAFAFAAQENLQTHGGIGYTWESDCQLFYRRARFTALMLGGALGWKERVMLELEHRNS